MTEKWVAVSEIEGLPARQKKKGREAKTKKAEEKKATVKETVEVEKSPSTYDKKAKPREVKYEYLDHTADIQFHAWGKDLTEAFEQVIICMFGYITELDKLDVDDEKTQSFEISGHDMESLLYNYMDEFLYRFNTDLIACKDVRIKEFDRENFKITVDGFGEKFNLKKHPQGTEIKAITYSNLQIHEKDGRADVYVIVDI